MRNKVEYESGTLPIAQSAVVKAAWAVIQEWAGPPTAILAGRWIR
jgi:hypothetical protein